MNITVPSCSVSISRVTLVSWKQRISASSFLQIRDSYTNYLNGIFYLVLINLLITESLNLKLRWISAILYIFYIFYIYSIYILYIQYIFYIYSIYPPRNILVYFYLTRFIRKNICKELILFVADLEIMILQVIS